ncbi:MAG: sigma-70 family RNA polymerase sigma factor [Spirochaetales bacterium]|nr:sigma-70 family RNA polymerase sigma factor [Spirochaetales bacterium]
MEHDPLTKMILGYKAGTVSQAEAILEATHEVFRYLKRFNPFRDEENQEFVASAYTMIPKAIDMFQYRGKPFQYYLYRVVKFRLIDYRKKLILDEKMNKFLIFLYSDSAVNYDSPETQLENQNSDAALWNHLATKSKISKAMRKRLLVALLHCADYASLSCFEEFCRQLDFDPKELEAYRLELKKIEDESMSQYDTRLSAYTQNLIKSWNLEEKMRLPTTSEEFARDREQYKSLKKTLKDSLSRLQGTRTSITHEQVAKVTGIPKGTIDSGMHYLKRNLAVVYNAAHGHTSRDKQCAQEKRADSVVADAPPVAPRRRRARRLGS